MLKIKVIFFILLTTMFSCSKEESIDNNVKPNSVNYTPMSVGNYWVYAYYNIDSSGTESINSRVDCVYISKIRLINGNEYYQFEGSHDPLFPNQTSPWILRDSSDYLVDTNGTINFAFNDFQDSLETRIIIDGLGDTLFSEIYQTRKVNQPVSVPAGNFDALNFHGTIKIHKPKLNQGIENPRSRNNYYSNNVGRILETFFSFTQYGYSERRLLRYHVQ